MFFFPRILIAVSLGLTLPLSLVSAPRISAQDAGGTSIAGIVRDADGKAVSGATVHLETKDTVSKVETKTAADGEFLFSGIPLKTYQLSAESSGMRSATVVVNGSSPQRDGKVQVALQLVPPSQEMQFSDQPHFSVAGVTDWTAVGGHGSDSTLRTSESLASATATLKADHAEPADGKNSERLRLAGERDEAKGDPLSAVREFEQAATLDPSEPNYFAWGSELLLHRAVWQAEVVFRKGATAFPDSVRMQTGLGTALFAGARYEEAAQRLCEASDLEPADMNPYLFMGKVQMAAPNTLSCIGSKLARFVKQQPESSVANYLYAMALMKSADAGSVPQAEALLNKAVTLDAKCSDADLELGVLAAQRRDNEGAIRFYKRAIEADPKQADAYYRLAVAYDRTGQPDKAKDAFAQHDRLKREQAEETERQRKLVKQFLFAAPQSGAAVSVQ